MPGRVGSPTVARSRGSGPAGRGRGCRSAWPAPGCTTRPAGLSITMHVVVLVDDRDLDVGLGHEGLGRGRRVDVDLDLVALDEAGRPLVATAPLRRIRPASSHSTTSVRLAPATMATTRSTRSPSSGPGTVSTTPMSGAVSSRWRTGSVAARWRRRGRPGRAPRRRSSAPSSGTGRKVLTTSRIAPTTTPMSATLKTGHHCRSMKSTTAPPRKPPLPARKARSIRLPRAPPTIRARATAARGGCARCGPARSAGRR